MIMFMFNRIREDKVGLEPLALEILIAQLFESCKNEHEVELLQKQLLNGNLEIKEVNLIDN